MSYSKNLIDKFKAELNGESEGARFVKGKSRSKLDFGKGKRGTNLLPKRLGKMRVQQVVSALRSTGTDQSRKLYRLHERETR